MTLPVRLFVAGTLAAALASLLSPSLAARQEADGAALRDAGLPGIRIERRRGEADRRLLENGELKHVERKIGAVVRSNIQCRRLSDGSIQEMHIDNGRNRCCSVVAVRTGG
jgi:hypothetical protein